MNNRIEVGTAFGTLFAEVNGNPDYPGITICIEQEGEDGRYDKQLAMAECTPDMPTEGGHALRFLVWNSDDTEDYTDDFTFFEDWPEEPPEVVWEKYLQYLRDWSKSHQGPGFYGMTPACFDEWNGAEYRQEMEILPLSRMTPVRNYKITLDGNEDSTFLMSHCQAKRGNSLIKSARSPVSRQYQSLCRLCAWKNYHDLLLQTPSD